jgi:DNA-binding XRE family transcriptional regulator
MNPNPLHGARCKAGLSAYELATAAGTREPRIYALERERYRPRPDEARGLAAVLMLPVEELFPAGVQQEGAR